MATNEERLAALEALRIEHEARHERLDKAFDSYTENVNSRFDAIEGRMERLEAAIVGVSNAVISTRGFVEGMDGRLDILTDSIESIRRSVGGGGFFDNGLVRMAIPSAGGGMALLAILQLLIGD